jgi:hypothetical protein
MFIVFENNVQKRTFGIKEKDTTGGQRKLHDEELHYQFSSPLLW